MKKTILLCLAFVWAVSMSAQDVMDKLADATCECVSKHENINDTEELKVKLGLCMMETALVHKKQLKKEHKIDMDKMDQELGEKLGRLVGARMAAVCPDLIMKIAYGPQGKESQPNKSPEKSMTGTINKIEKEFLVCFSVKEESGKFSKLYWLGTFETELDIVDNYDSMVGKKLTFSYRSQEFFDPKIGEYRPMLVITKLESAD